MRTICVSPCFSLSAIASIIAREKPPTHSGVSGSTDIPLSTYPDTSLILAYPLSPPCSTDIPCIFRPYLTYAPSYIFSHVTYNNPARISPCCRRIMLPDCLRHSDTHATYLPCLHITAHVLAIPCSPPLSPPTQLCFPILVVSLPLSALLRRPRIFAPLQVHTSRLCFGTTFGSNSLFLSCGSFRICHRSRIYRHRRQVQSRQRYQRNSAVYLFHFAPPLFFIFPVTFYQ